MKIRRRMRRTRKMAKGRRKRSRTGNKRARAGLPQNEIFSRGWAIILLLISHGLLSPLVK